MVPPDNRLSGGTPLTWSLQITNYPEGPLDMVPPDNELSGGTVPPNNKLSGGTVPPDNHIH